MSLEDCAKVEIYFMDGPLMVLDNLKLPQSPIHCTNPDDPRTYFFRSRDGEPQLGEEPPLIAYTRPDDILIDDDIHRSAQSRFGSEPTACLSFLTGREATFSGQEKNTLRQILGYCMNMRLSFYVIGVRNDGDFTPVLAGAYDASNRRMHVGPILEDLLLEKEPAN